MSGLRWTLLILGLAVVFNLCIALARAIDRASTRRLSAMEEGLLIMLVVGSVLWIAMATWFWHL